MLNPRLLPALALLALASCHSAAPGHDRDLDLALQELGAGRPAEALPKFEAALDALEAERDGPRFKQAAVGYLEALAQERPGEVSGTLTELHGSDPELLTAADCSRVGTVLAEHDEAGLALHVVGLAKEWFPEDAALAERYNELYRAPGRKLTPEEVAAMSAVGYLDSE